MALNQQHKMIIDDDVEEENLSNQDSDSKDGACHEPVKQTPTKFTSGTFVVLKSDLINEHPVLWRIDGKSLLQKYIPFKKCTGQVLYKNISVYSKWSTKFEMYYHIAPVSIIEQALRGHIVDFHKDRIEI